MSSFTGGEKLQARLKKLAQNVAKGSAVRAGFLEGTRYDDGTSMPLVAATHEFGGTVNVAAHDTTIYRKINKDGTFAHDGRFVKKKSSNFASDHHVGSHTINIPARPFFRPAIANNATKWGDVVAAVLEATDFDAAKALGAAGVQIAGDIQQAIQDVTSPPLAPSTIARKSKGGVNRSTGVMGPEKPLIDSARMWKSVSSVVDE